VGNGEKAKSGTGRADLLSSARTNRGHAAHSPGSVFLDGRQDVAITSKWRSTLRVVAPKSRIPTPLGFGVMRMRLEVSGSYSAKP
jgi:hypothetical protein